MSKLDLSTNKISISPLEQPQNNQFQSTTKKTNKNIQYRNNIYDSDFVKFENLRNLDKDEFINKSVKSNNSSFKGSDAYKFKMWNLETGLTKQKEKSAQTFLVPFFEAVKKLGMSKPSLISFKGSEQQVAEVSLLERLNNAELTDAEFKARLTALTDTDGNPRFADFQILDLLAARTKDNASLMDELTALTDTDGNPRFDEYQILRLLKAKTDENVPLIKELLASTDKDGNFRFNETKILKLLKVRTDENVSLMKKLIDSTDKDGNPIFDVGYISYLLSLRTDKNALLMDKLVESKDKDGIPIFGLNNIFKILILYKKFPEIIDKFLKNKDLVFLLKNMDEDNIKIWGNDNLFNIIKENMSEDVTDITLSSPYFDNNYRLSFNNSKIFDFNINPDNSIKLNAKELIKVQGDNSLVRREFSNGEVLVGKIFSITEDDDGTELSIPISQMKTLYDNNGIPIRSEVIAPSIDKSTEYTINVYERGLNKTVKKNCIGTVDIYGSKNQGLCIEKNLVSTDGSKTKQIRIEGPKGTASKYKITDKDGNIIFNQERKYRKLDENHYQSSLNDKKYDYIFENNSIMVSQLDTNGNPLKTIYIGKEQLDPQLMDLFKELPGDYFFKIKEMKVKIILDGSISNNASYSWRDNAIHISREFAKDKFVFAHELGHVLDIKAMYNLNRNKELIKIYQQELENYKAVTSDNEGYVIDYFINRCPNEPLYALLETIAESNALLSGLNKEFDQTRLRSIVLQQYFPKTIAFIGNSLNSLS